MSNIPLFLHDGAWHAPDQDINLSPIDVHVWKVGLTAPAQQLSKLQSLLSPDEQERAERMKLPRHQQAFITARGMLRLLISRYLNTDAESLYFSHGPKGKPFLSHPLTNPSLCFNLSHSHDLGLFAFSFNRAVGIDLEFKHRNRNYPELMVRICSDQEKKIMASLEPPEQENAFLACWTRKEAYLKATGQGITFPLHSITVSLPPTDSISLLHVDGNEEETTRWTMHDIQADLDYTAALVVAGNDWQPIYWEWSWEMMPDSR